MRFFPIALFLSMMPVFLSAQEGDSVTLEDGSVVHGEVLSLAEGALKVKTSFSGTVSIEFSKVTRLRISRVLSFLFEDRVKHRATAASPGDRKLEL